MDKDRTPVQVHPAPVGAAMALALGEVQRLASQALQVVARLQAEDAEDRTHGKLLGMVWCYGFGPDARPQKNPHRPDAGFVVTGLACF